MTNQNEFTRNKVFEKFRNFFRRLLFKVRHTQYKAK